MSVLTATTRSTALAETRRPHIVALSGNMRRPSTTRILSEMIGRTLAARIDCEVEYLDLLDAGPGLGSAFTPDQLDENAQSVLASVSEADGLIVSSPVYKGSYPGLLKHLFDLIDPAALADRPVLLAAVGGGPKHALIIEHQLRPLFGFFTAFAVPTGIYATGADFAEGQVTQPAVSERVEMAVRQFARLLETSVRPA